MDPWAAVVPTTFSEPDTPGSGSDKLVSSASSAQPAGLQLPSIQDTLDSSEKGTRPDSSNLFEDHFVPDARRNSDDNTNFEKLPDTQQYLASLERKLQKLQKGKDTPDGLLESLQQTREASLVNLLTNNAHPVDTTESEEIRLNPILNKLIPEKSALTVEELVHLVHADQLSLSQETDHEPHSTSNGDEAVS